MTPHLTKKKVVWMPHAGHYIGSRICLFRMNTYVNGYIISSVGDSVDPITGEVQEIGMNRKFETFVFKAVKNRNKEQSACCPYTYSSPSEIDSRGYNDAGKARLGHMEMIAKYSLPRKPHGKNKK